MAKKIKHLIITKDGRNCYLCIHACSITKEKSVWKKEEVTCKNCLRILRKHPTYRQVRKYKVVKDD